MSNLLSLANAIRVMLLIGCVAVFLVIVQSCQQPKSGLDAYRTGTLKRLEVQDAPPVQPSLTFKTDDGREMRLSDYRGQYVLLNVWATWCPPCVAEMPSLDALQAARGSSQFQVITVSMDRHPSEAAKWFDEQDIRELTPWHDGSRGLSAKLGALGLPVSIIYDRSGREIARVSGEADWISEEALALVDKLVAN